MLIHNFQENFTMTGCSMKKESDQWPIKSVAYIIILILSLKHGFTMNGLSLNEED